MADQSLNNPEPVQIPESKVNIQIRTQATDVESLKQTGGAHPLPETLSVNSLPQTGVPPAPIETPSVPVSTEAVPTPPAGSRRSFTWIFWLIGIAILFLVGYYLIPLFFG